MTDVLEWCLGTAWAVAVCMFALVIAVAICRALFGSVITVLLIVGFAALAVASGLSSMINADHLAVQVLGWMLTVAVVGAVLKGVQVYALKLRDAFRADSV
jgi:hypothetical protein